MYFFPQTNYMMHLYFKGFGPSKTMSYPGPAVIKNGSVKESVMVALSLLILILAFFFCMPFSTTTVPSKTTSLLTWSS